MSALAASRAVNGLRSRTERVVIELVSDLIRNYCGRDFARVDDDVTTLAGTRER